MDTVIELGRRCCVSSFVSLAEALRYSCSWDSCRTPRLSSVLCSWGGSQSSSILWALTSVKRQSYSLSAHNCVNCEVLVVIMLTKLLILSFSSQLTAYVRQKHIISNYLKTISNYMHIIVIMWFCAASNGLLESKVHNYNYVHIIINYVDTA